MSRRISIKKRYLNEDLKHDSLLVSLLTNRLLKNGKKFLAKKILSKAFKTLEEKTDDNPILGFEKAIRNVSPQVQLKAKRIKDTTYQLPVMISRYRSTNMAIKWLIEFAKKRPGKSMSLKLANEIFDASKGSGGSIRKKEQMHKMVESSKSFIEID